MTLLEALGVDEHRYVFLIGGGGKTTLMSALARELAARGETVVTTTSTRILRPTEGDVAVGEMRDLIQMGLRPCTFARAEEGGKLLGFSATDLDLLRDAWEGWILVEADGSAGRSLKAHETWEPVISWQAERVIVVVGADCVGMPLDAEHVHRAALFGEILGKEMGSPITVADVVGILFHPRGYLREVPAKAEVAIWLSRASLPVARELADALREGDREGRVGRIVRGDLP